jgi:hypothetical protein
MKTLLPGACPPRETVSNLAIIASGDDAAHNTSEKAKSGGEPSGASLSLWEGL